MIAATGAVAEGHDRPTPTGAVGEASAGPAGTVPTTEAEAPTIAAAMRPPVSYAFVPPDVWALVRAFAVVLGETMPPPIRLITRAVDRLGPERARALLGQALTVEAQGGLTLPDGHRRTPGGVFFYLVRASDEISREDKDDIFPCQSGRPMRAGGNGTPASATPAPAVWTDATFRALAPQLQHDTGRATTVKITVIGRPAAAVEHGQASPSRSRARRRRTCPRGCPRRPLARATPSSSPASSGRRSPRPSPPTPRTRPSSRATPPSIRAWRASPSTLPAPPPRARRPPSALRQRQRHERHGRRGSSTASTT